VTWVAQILGPEAAAVLALDEGDEAGRDLIEAVGAAGPLPGRVDFEAGLDRHQGVDLGRRRLAAADDAQLVVAALGAALDGELHRRVAWRLVGVVELHAADRGVRHRAHLRRQHSRAGVLGRKRRPARDGPLREAPLLQGSCSPRP
jgi:hypothetical protein